jgi:hypothetical protein
MAALCKASWESDVGPVKGQEDVPIDFRDATGRVSVACIRSALKESVARDPKFGPIAIQKEVELDPEKYSKRRTGKPAPERKLSPVVSQNFRLSPIDGVLEFRLILAAAVLWVPVIPKGDSPFSEGESPSGGGGAGSSKERKSTLFSWRRWVFADAHDTLLNSHRSANETFHVLRR